MQTSDGIWSKTDGVSTALPLALPQLPPSSDHGLQYIQDFWLPADYYRRARVSGDPGTPDYLEGWFEDSLSTGPARHPESGTFIGGHRGVVWIVRCLIHTLANIGACIGKVKPPLPAPSGYQLDRLGSGLWSRCFTWLEKLCKGIEGSNKILAESAEERVYPPEAPEGGPDDASDDAPTAGPASVKKKRRNTRRKQTSDSEEVLPKQPEILPPRQSKLLAKDRVKQAKTSRRDAQKGWGEESEESESDSGDSDRYEPPPDDAAGGNDGAIGDDEDDDAEPNNGKPKDPRGHHEGRKTKGMCMRILRVVFAVSTFFVAV